MPYIGMKQLILSILLLTIVGNGFSQVPWNFTPTNHQHLVMIPQGTISFATTSISNGDCVGVFFDSLGTEACGGYTIYTGYSFSIVAFGDTWNTPAKEGFSMAEPMSFKVWRASDSAIFSATATYLPSIFMPDSGLFVSGVSEVSLLEVDVIDHQNINIPQGWSLISTYIDPFEPNFDSICAPIASSIEMCKNGSGMVYWPQFGINAIGNAIIGEGYQMKASTADTLDVEGLIVDVANTTIQIPQGWSLIGYLLTNPEPLTTVMNPIDTFITIMKNTNGSVYWPQYGINLIGDMIPGQGYQIKLTTAQNFSFIGATALPTVLTGWPANITSTTASCGGGIFNQGSSAVIVSGICWSTSPNPTLADFHTTSGSQQGVFSNLMSGLMSNTQYYVRAYATNSVGTAYGADSTFITMASHLCGGTITDVDGNYYETTLIGSQCWMAKNLNTTRYADGSPIVDGTLIPGMGGNTIKYYYDYDTITNTQIYGKLYNWHAVMNGASSTNAVPSGVQGICPWGWHVPSDEEWKMLEGEVDSQLGYPNNNWNNIGFRGTDCGSHLKSSGGWFPSTLGGNGTNTYGFKAMPGGLRTCTTPINMGSIGGTASFWTSTAGTNVDGICRELSCYNTAIYRFHLEFNHGMSVRCLKD